MDQVSFAQYEQPHLRASHASALPDIGFNIGSKPGFRFPPKDRTWAP